MSLVTSIAVFFLAAFVGFYIISRIPNQLHTPLMSATNALHGLVLLGAMVAIGGSAVAGNWGSLVLAIIAIAFGTINIVGGFLVTDRMLVMFRVGQRPAAAAPQESEEDRDIIKVGADT